MDYKSLLKRARTNLPEDVDEKERFEIPKVKGHIQGSKTVVSNFLQIAAHLGRDPDQMLKYILKELATPGTMKKSLVEFGSKVPASRINQKITEYAERFVFCKECGKPDTQLYKENRVTLMRCTACGAKYPVNG